MNFYVSASPHIRSEASTATIMRDVVYALLPACIVGVIAFGFNAALLLMISVASAVISEFFFNKIAKRPLTVNDFSAVVTGLLLGMNLPATAPWWVAVIGGAFAIIIVKCLFGGIGCNFVNPALAARAFLMACWPLRMTTWVAPRVTYFTEIDAVSTATPLAALASGEPTYAIGDMLLGLTPGCIGEASAIALLIGAIYLLCRGVINLRVPAVYIVTVFVLSLFIKKFDFMYSLQQILSGGLFLGALFMANDYTTSPVTPYGQLIMGFGCGVLTVLIRQLGGYPEGVSYSILLMNLCSPLIERYTRPRAFGEAKGRKAVFVKKSKEVRPNA